MIKISSFNHSALLTLIVLDIRRRLDISTTPKPPHSMPPCSKNVFKKKIVHEGDQTKTLRNKNQKKIQRDLRKTII